LFGGFGLRRGERRGYDFVCGIDRVRLDHHQRSADRHLVANFAREFDDDSRHRRLHLDGGLVGHHVRDRRILLDAVADGDVPCDDLGLGNAFADVRQLEGEAGHQKIPFVASEVEKLA
jgi:hypothetical protein